MTNWKLTLAYDGTPFNGWQIQPGLPTIQGTLAEAIHRITGELVLPQGSGRTDTGVHALEQVASVSLKAPIPATNLHRALNRILPDSIRILTVEAAPSSFHARHSASRKAYEYRIFPARAEVAHQDSGVTSRDANYQENICPPTLAPWVWACHWPLDLVALNQAASHVLGTHDFTSFAASAPDMADRCASASDPGAPCLASETCVDGQRRSLSRTGKTNVRTIHRSHWDCRDGLIVYTVTGSGFLHHMVRNLVGTFVQAGAHRIPPSAIREILTACNRSAAGPTAPARGLFLISVEYPAQLDQLQFADMDLERKTF
jgi:tRNA pseudouridine38-40 synthase